MFQSLNFGFRMKFFYAVDYVKVEVISSDMPCCTNSFTFRLGRKFSHHTKIGIKVIKCKVTMIRHLRSGTPMHRLLNCYRKYATIIP